VSSDTRSLAAESVDATLEITDDQTVTIALTGVVKGRVFADGVVVMREYGATTAVPDWVPAAP
jgi:hypothetical protein